MEQYFVLVTSQMAMQGHEIQPPQYHQVSKMVFSLIETWPSVSDNLSVNSTCISEDMNRFSSVNRRLRFKNHSPTDALIVKQSASWPYLSDSRDLEVRACPYVQMRVDIYTRPLTNVADFSLDLEIYQKEAWQNQLCVQRMISLLNYCIENASGELCNRAIVLCTEDMFEFTRAFNHAKQEMNGNIRLWKTDGNCSQRTGPRGTRSICECPMDTLLKILNDLDRDRHTFGRTPMPLGFQAREIILKEVCNLDQVDSYIRDHRPLWHETSHARKIFVNTCLGENRHKLMSKLVQFGQFHRVPVVDAFSLDMPIIPVPIPIMQNLFGYEIDMITRLKRTAFDASPYLTPGNYISPILNTVCTFSFDNEATQRDHHNELEKLCTVIMHNDDLYLETMSVLGKLNWNEEYGYARWLKLKTCGMNLSNLSHRWGRLLA